MAPVAERRTLLPTDTGALGVSGSGLFSPTQVLPMEVPATASIMAPGEGISSAVAFAADPFASSYSPAQLDKKQPDAGNPKQGYKGYLPS